MNFRSLLFAALATSALAGPAPTIQRDIAYVANGHARQKLDLYLPTTGNRLPLIVWIHGGSWTEGDKSQNPALPLVAQGFAVACINYRFSQHAPFPAQLEDCKSAIRWLRAHAATLRLDPTRIGAWGISAGGHLAALLGTTGDVPEFDAGENLNVSSRVQCVIDWCGPTDFEQLDDPAGIAARDAVHSPITRLLGGPVPRQLALARRASPLRFVSADDPPFLIMHGDRDNVVPQKQSELLYAALQKAHVPAILNIIKNGQHIFFNHPLASQQALQFLRAQLRP